jgi:hypothetical protein
VARITLKIECPNQYDEKQSIDIEIFPNPQKKIKILKGLIAIENTST